MMRIIIFGNSGCGKSTMARRLVGENNVALLSLDAIAWQRETIRKPLDESIRELLSFIHTHPQWVIEGCYADLIAPALPFCTELRFLNPGTATCIANCRGRPWEPEKFSSAQAQQAMLEPLIAWVRQYDTRDDEFGLRRHRALFDAFTGPKVEFKSMSDGATS